MENKIIYVSAAVVLVLIYVVATYEPVTNGEVKTYFCTKDAFYGYLKKMVDFKKGPTEVLFYPDDFDYSTQIPIEDIKKMAENSCENPYGVPTRQYLGKRWTNRTKLGWAESVSTYARCAVEGEDGSWLTVWGFKILDGKEIVPDTPRRSLEGGRMSWDSGFGFVDIGLCFQE